MAAKTSGVVVRQAQPVYGTVHVHQGRGVQLTDDPVVLYGLIARRTLFGRHCCLVYLHLLGSSFGLGLARRAVVAFAIQPPHQPSHRHRVYDGPNPYLRARG